MSGGIFQNVHISLFPPHLPHFIFIHCPPAAPTPALHGPPFSPSPSKGDFLSGLFPLPGCPPPAWLTLPLPPGLRSRVTSKGKPSQHFPGCVPSYHHNQDPLGLLRRSLSSIYTSTFISVSTCSPSLFCSTLALMRTQPELFSLSARSAAPNTWPV